MRVLSPLLALTCLTSPATAAPPATPTATSPAPPLPATVTGLAHGAQLFADLGVLTRPVGTATPEAQRYFDQGLRLAYGFNHDEATRSFARAAELDPGCAACLWGVAWTLGPNYNVPMLPERAQAAWDALQAARERIARARPVEQGLITALVSRYRGPGPVEPPAQQPMNEAFARAMREVARSYPDDDDVQVIFAESLMDVNPWHLWTLDGKPAPGTEEIVSALERVLARNAQHPGANHYQIHAVEASGKPERAVAPAERLPGLMPAAGHIVHMPAHIFQRVGRYAEASEANRRAVRADEAYLAKTTPPGYYPMYLGHNWGFLSYSASMLGRSEESLRAAREATKALPPEMLDMMPGMDFFASEPLLAMVRFGKWKEILAQPRPASKYPTLTGLWLHARGMALASTGRTGEARTLLRELRTLASTMPADVMAGQNPASAMCRLGADAIEARIAERARRWPEAIAAWTRAVAQEDGFAYDEPADWFYPMRHYLGAALLDAKKPKDAEAVFREDLRRNPNNGWALHGLAAALSAQGRKDEASAVRKDFDAAWKQADITLTRTAL
ncbi:MAG TPA: tetratricopeptide repeat protein [Myxococcaceae bacterium]|nr:tetratricopeptide repeat protein [Myxococcaceae bacterium]